MSLPPISNHRISLEEASALTANFRRQAGIGAPKGGMFWKEIILEILSQPGCAGLRYYHGREDSGKPVLVLVGVDIEGKDMTQGILAERGWVCPPFCADELNDLNSSVAARRRAYTVNRIRVVGDRKAVRRVEEPTPVPTKVSKPVE